MLWVIIGAVILGVLMALGATVWVVYDAIRADNQRGEGNSLGEDHS